MKKICIYATAFIVLFCLSCTPPPGRPPISGKLAVCVTTPDIADITKQIGGEFVDVYCFTKGPEDPHVVDLKPEFVKKLHEAHLLVDVGIGIAGGWLPKLLESSKRADLHPGQSGYLDLSEKVDTIQEEEGHSHGTSLHEEGNPHFLLSPVEGIKAAKTICLALSELYPEQKQLFESNYNNFRSTIADLLVGKQIAEKYSIEEVSQKLIEEKLQDFLGDDAKHLSGWYQQLSPFQGTYIVGDHDLWPYLARQYGLKVLQYLEPQPGVPPTIQHLKELIEEMKQHDIKIIVTSPYFDEKHVDFTAKNSGAKVLKMAHQVGARPDCETYTKMISYNFQQLIRVLEGRKDD